MSRWLASFLLVTAAHAAPLPVLPPDPYAGIAFDQILHGELTGGVLLGFSADGTSWAYVDVETTDDRLTVVADLVSTATGKPLFHMRLVPQRRGSVELDKSRVRYDDFLDKVRAAGVMVEHARPWKQDGTRFASPDGKQSVELVHGTERAVADGTWSGEVDALRLEPGHIVLAELEPGSEPARILEVLGSPKDDAFVVRTTSSRRFGSDLVTAIYGTSLDKLHAQEPVRALVRRGLDSYLVGDLHAAQSAFRAAVALDTFALRPRYNLAAVSARLGDNREALRMLSTLVDVNPIVLRRHVTNDPDFALARVRPAYQKYAEPMIVGAFSPQSKQGLATRLAVVGSPSVKQGVQLELIVENRGEKPARFSRFVTPFEGVRGHFMEVADDNGKAVPYAGIMVKRSPPGPADYITIAPHAEARATFDLRRGYELTAGNYVVRLLGANGLPDSPAIPLTITP